MTHSYGSTRHCFRDCVICETPRLEGINVLKAFICNKCEQQMVRTETGEEKYPIYVSKLKPLQTYFIKHIPGAVQK